MRITYTSLSRYKSTWATIIILNTLIFEFLFNASFFKSSMLVADDNFFLTEILFNEKFKPNPKILHHYILACLRGFQSIPVFKLTLFIMPLSIGLSTYYIIFRFSRSFFFSIATAVFVIHFPISIGQNTFVLGSHPLAGATVIFLFLSITAICFENPEVFNKFPQAIFIIFIQSLLLFAGFFMTPILILLPITCVMSTLIVLMFNWKDRGWKYSDILLLSLSCVVIIACGYYYRENHYARTPGKLDVSILQVISNLQAALNQTFVIFKRAPIWIKLTYGFGLVSTIIGLWFISMKEKKSSDLNLRNFHAFAAFLILCGALAFGPVSIITQYASRYTFIPFLCVVLAICIVISSRLRNKELKYVPLYALLPISAVIHNGIATQRSLLPFQSGHELIEAALSQKTWGQQDQFLILLPDGIKSTSSGFHHWSSGYLRAILRQPDTIGVIGTQNNYVDIQKHGVFIQPEQVSGDFFANYYTEMKGGARVRKRMFGLDPMKPTYTFADNGEGELEIKTLIVWNDAKVKLIEPGKNLQSVPFSDVDFMNCSKLYSDKAFTVSRLAKIPNFVGNNKTVDDSFHFDGSNMTSHKFTQAAGEYPQILSFRLRYGGNFSGNNQDIEVFPPMPMLSKNLAVYQYKDYFKIIPRSGGKTLQIQHNSDTPVDVDIVGCNGQKAYIFVNRSLEGEIFNMDFGAELQLGKGFKSRYWEGDIENLKLEKLGN